jgi:hypothetical protein
MAVAQISDSSTAGLVMPDILNWLQGQSVKLFLNFFGGHLLVTNLVTNLDQCCSDLQ